jgi:hypothetical protein
VFEDRALRLLVTFGGAGVLHGDLTPECAEAMTRLLAAGLLPERAGQPVKAWVNISLADLMLLDGSLCVVVVSLT